MKSSFLIPILLLVLLLPFAACDDGDDGVKPDTTPPTVVVAQPLNGAEVSDLVEIVAEAADNRDVASVTFEVDLVELGSDDAPPFTWTWDTTFHDDISAHTIKVEATDGSDNVSAPAYALVTLDEAGAHRLGLVSPAPGYVAGNAEAVQLSWSGLIAASGYEVEVSADPDFATVEQAVSVTGMTTTLSVLPTGVYYWRARAVDANGWVTVWSNVWSFSQGALAICCAVRNNIGEPIENAVLNVIYDIPSPWEFAGGARMDQAPPPSSGVYPAYPNPTNGATTLRFSLTTQALVTVTVEDRTGVKVRDLVQGTLSPGVHQVLWDGLDDEGDMLPNGTYKARFEIGEEALLTDWICLHRPEITSLVNMTTHQTDAEGRAYLSYDHLAVGDELRMTTDSPAIVKTWVIPGTLEVNALLNESTWITTAVNVGSMSSGMDLLFEFDR